MPGQIQPVELGVNPLRLWPTKFDKAGIQCNLSEFTPNLTSNLCPVELLGILHCTCWEFLTTFTENSLLGILHCFTWDYIVCLPMNFHPIWWVINAQSNLTGRIGCKSIEIMTTKFNQAGIHLTRQAYNVISVNLHPIWPVIYAQSNCWEFFIALAENSSLLLLKIVYWEFFTASLEITLYACQWISIQFDE